MSINWSTSELEAIKKQTLKDSKPSYYSLTNKNYIQISEDFEGYLILQGGDQKQKVLTWMSDVSKINNDTKDQNAILNRFLEIRYQDTSDRITELDEKLNKYSEMQTELITDGTDPSRYGSIIEINLMVKCISKSIDNINLQREQAFHEQNMVTAVQNAIQNEQVSDDTTKELTSWQTIMSTYKGQTSKSGSKVSKPSMGGLF